MYLTPAHIGKEIRWSMWERERSFLLVRIDGGGQLSGRNIIIGGKLCESDTWQQGENWELVEPDAVPVPEPLPASIERLMEAFSCYEKQTRALVAAILKEVKENTR